MGEAYLFNYEDGTPKSLSSFVTVLLGMDHYFFIGGLPFLGLADNFLRVMHFKQCFSLHFVMKTIFYDHF